MLQPLSPGIAVTVWNGDVPPQELEKCVCFGEVDAREEETEGRDWMEILYPLLCRKKKWINGCATLFLLSRRQREMWEEGAAVTILWAPGGML